MRFLEIVAIYIAVSTYGSKAEDIQYSLNAQTQGAVEPNYWSYYQLNSLTTESLSNNNINENGPVAKQKDKIVKSNNLENHNKISTQNHKINQETRELLYVNAPPKNASSDMYDIKIIKYDSPQYLRKPDLYKTKKNETPKSNTTHIKDKTCCVLMRDTDAFYDNKLIQKVTGSKGELPKSLHIGSLNIEPILIYKESNRETIHPYKTIEKREVKKSDYDYSYYDDKNPDESNAIKGGFPAIKQKISKIMKPQEKHNTKPTNKNVLKTNSYTPSSDYQNSYTLISSQPLQATTYSNNESITATVETKSTSNQLDENGSEEANKISDPNDTYGSEENTNIKSAPRKKDPCKFGSDESSKCLPQGGIPKNPGIPPIGRNRDPEYDKLIKGEIPEKVVKAILDKVKKNPTMSSELGICEVDLKEIKDLFNSIRNKQNECCMKLKGEFKCFLNWLLTIDPSRKKRSAQVKQREIGKTNLKTKYVGNKFSAYDGVHIPSPQYRKLYEDVERVKEERGDPWDFGPEAADQIPDNSINF